MDPVASLGLNIVALPRVFALLLGSGVSRGAAVPTGHDVTLDLIGRVAAASGADPGPDPEAWYIDTTGQTPRYSDLLASLGTTPAARQALLRDYFEPTEEDRQHGRRVPSQAHRAIARMVREGWFSVILTTNFDRLLERAIDEEGVPPVVISTVGALQGAAPPQHNACTIIKLHGDYLEQNIRNTEAELADYEPELSKYLDRLLDEYGLIIAGWSAEWDAALRNHLEARANRRYPLYWVLRGEPNEFQRKLIVNTGATVTTSPSADEFFSALHHAVDAASGRQAVSSRGADPDAAVATLKHLLSEERGRIRLRDLVVSQTEAAVEAMTNARFAVDGAEQATVENVSKRMHAYEAATETCIALAATGSYWAREEQQDVFLEMVKRVANIPQQHTGTVVWIELQHYPALLLMYACGVALVAAGREADLVELWSIPVRHPNGDAPASSALNPWKVVDHDVAKRLPTMPKPNLVAPLSEYLLMVLRPHFRSIIPAQMDYERIFDRFEYLSSLLQADGTGGNNLGLAWFYVGRFSWQSRFEASPLRRNIEGEVARQGTEWPLLKAGAFGGQIERFEQVKATVDEGARRMAF